MQEDRRVAVDLDAYVRDVQQRPCFICALAAGDQNVGGEIVFRDDARFAFLPNHFVQRGYVLVAPVEHREAVIDDFALEEYLDIQALVYRVGAALTAVVPTERIYILSLGSQQGNAHVHWHVAALPPGVPYEKQQYHALMAEHGVLDVQAEERHDLAARLAEAITDP